MDRFQEPFLRNFFLLVFSFVVCAFDFVIFRIQLCMQDNKVRTEEFNLISGLVVISENTTSKCVLVHFGFH